MQLTEGDEDDGNAVAECQVEGGAEAASCQVVANRTVRRIVLELDGKSEEGTRDPHVGDDKDPSG